MTSSASPISTARLTLSPLHQDDADEVFAVYGDPATWNHLPSGRHERRAQSESMIDGAERSWKEWGLGPWAVRVGDAGAGPGVPPGSFIGTGGVGMNPIGVWNLGYRLAPMSWGRGFATELSSAALIAAWTARPGVAVTARILSSNRASAAVARRIGLTLCWVGPTSELASEEVHREIYADRILTEPQLEWFAARA
jgi:RimJ/RimL family protein N-acetyltransferase